jgi:mono/diheme cytochrome c family protein
VSAPRLLLAALGLPALLSLACATAGAAAGPPRSEGERIYRAHCAACHRLRDPGEQTSERWAWAVAKYGPRAHLSPEQQPRVLEYLQSRASDAAPAR